VRRKKATTIAVPGRSGGEKNGVIEMKEMPQRKGGRGI